MRTFDADCDVLASEAERRDQPSGLCRDNVWSRRVGQKDAPGHAEEKHAFRHDKPQRLDGCPEERRLKPGRDRPGSTGHFHQHQSFPDSDRLHCRTSRNAGAAEPVPSLGKNRNSTATDKEHAETRPLSGNSSLSKTAQNKKKRKKNQPCQREAMNACWTNGWKRPEVTGAIKEALEENKTKFDHLVDKEMTADAIDDFKTVTSAAQPFLAKTTKDEEDWVIRSREAKER